MTNEKLLAWRLRVAMAMADITTQELAYEAGVKPHTVYECRMRSGNIRASEGVWSILFYCIEQKRPGTRKALKAMEEIIYG